MKIHTLELRFAVERGQVYRTTHRRVRVSDVSDDLQPKVTLVDITDCTHNQLTALSGGVCPVCPTGTPIVSYLQFVGAAWRMGPGYEIVS